MISFREVIGEIDLFKILRLSLRRIGARAFGTINKFAFDVSAEFRELLRYLNREMHLHRFLPSFIKLAATVYYRVTWKIAIYFAI